MQLHTVAYYIGLQLVGLVLLTLSTVRHRRVHMNCLRVSELFLTIIFPPLAFLLLFSQKFPFTILKSFPCKLLLSYNFSVLPWYAFYLLKVRESLLMRIS